MSKKRYTKDGKELVPYHELHKYKMKCKRTGKWMKFKGGRWIYE